MGKTVIGTDIGGTTELINHGINGLLYSPGNYFQLSDEIEFLINNPEKLVEFGKKAINDVKDFLSDNPADQQIEIISRKIKIEKNTKSDYVREFIQQILINSINNITNELKITKNSIEECEDDLIRLATSKSWNYTRLIRKVIGVFKRDR